MKIFAVIKKSIIEQKRNFWVFILTITMAPFFVFVYYLINESSKPHFDILLLNKDIGFIKKDKKINYGNRFIDWAKKYSPNESQIPLSIKIIKKKEIGISKIKNKDADVLVIFPESFSENIEKTILKEKGYKIDIEFIGDLTNLNYLIAAVWGNAVFENYIYKTLKIEKIFNLKETGIGDSAIIRDFDLFIPGMLILSIIMLMFSATIAIITEVENKTIIRFKLSNLNTFEYLFGVSIVQILIGIISILLTLSTALLLGFKIALFSLIVLLFIGILSSISIIAFSLILAAFTKSANEVLVVGNFPMFLFMFFTGAAFPIKGKLLFTIAGYKFTLQGLMSPTHAINALKKILIMKMDLSEIVPEISVLIIITALYFLLGGYFFKKRHMKLF